MKKSELKEIIRTSLLEEMEYDGPSTYKDYNDGYNKLHSIKEAEEDSVYSKGKTKESEIKDLEKKIKDLEKEFNSLSPKQKDEKWTPEAIKLMKAQRETRNKINRLKRQIKTGSEGSGYVKKYGENKGKPIENKKIKKPELKEMEYDGPSTYKAYNDWYNKLHSINEAEEAEDVEVEDEVEVTADEKEGIDVKQDAESDITGIVGDVQDNLEAALEASRKLGDEKLVDQIGNTLTFFTRTHVVKEEAQIDVDMDSSDEYLKKRRKAVSKAVNEASRFKGSEIYPDWLTPKDFESPVKSVNDLKKGNLYIILDRGMNQWQGEYKYNPSGTEQYTFTDNAQFSNNPDMNFSKAELLQLIANGDIWIQSRMKLDESITRMKKLAGIIK